MTNLKYSTLLNKNWISSLKRTICSWSLTEYCFLSCSDTLGGCFGPSAHKSFKVNVHHDRSFLQFLPPPNIACKNKERRNNNNVPPLNVTSVKNIPITPRASSTRQMPLKPVFCCCFAYSNQIETLYLFPLYHFVKKKKKQPSQTQCSYRRNVALSTQQKMLGRYCQNLSFYLFILNFFRKIRDFAKHTRTKTKGRDKPIPIRFHIANSCVCQIYNQAKLCTRIFFKYVSDVFQLGSKLYKMAVHIQQGIVQTITSHRLHGQRRTACELFQYIGRPRPIILEQMRSRMSYAHLFVVVLLYAMCMRVRYICYVGTHCVYKEMRGE
ncbi:hypothetical protein RFI_10084 [Reticulomyxa filosa]|uniref:Uncharacterized protein n=1 Tax=Reticulomyxa filosa TaxID=46433 RepID=X6NM94_RETFI|nr:hypothetical protein RFI_10084 [Reticulomyxa filosa]|eukprot:ETO27048.1 hypothetical protein RFI_10084 [Reticulomyxa filosa]